MLQQKIVVEYLHAYYRYHPRGKLLLLAAPGWGKTSLLSTLYSSTVTLRRWLYLSPLRELNLELIRKLEEQEIPVVNAEQDERVLLLMERLKATKEGMVVMTPEKLMSTLKYNWIEFWNPIIVLDECHLYPMWQNFRPTLNDCWEWLATTHHPWLMMSGSWNWRTWLATSEGKFWLQQIDSLDVLDLQAQVALRPPWKSVIFPSIFLPLVLLLLKLILIFNREMRLLVFFPLKSMVGGWQRWCQKRNIISYAFWGGKTAQAKEFWQHIHQLEAWVIFSTSVLSHGVNLPAVKVLIILGNRWEKEMWTQLKSRAGRRGEKFILISEKQHWM